MTSKLTRERIELIANFHRAMTLPPSHDEIEELARMALAAMDSEPVAWDYEWASRITCEGPQNFNRVIEREAPPEWSIEEGQAKNIIQPYRHAQPAPERDQIRREHAEWSQATFGDAGPIGPLKHLSKEALEAAAEPVDLSEWADMQFLLWDAQRRAGITDEQITQAMIEKLAVNKQREWPEPKDGEPRLHIKEQPAPVVRDERKSFESFMAERFGDSVDHRRAKNGDQGYMAWDMVVAWIVWQARAMLQAGNSPVIPDSSAAGLFNSARALLGALYEFGPDEIAISEHVTNLEDALRNAAASQPQNEPQNIPEIIPVGHAIVPVDLLSELRDWAHPEIEKYCEMWEGRRDSEFPALRKVIADADALLAAAPQEVKGE